MKKIFIIVTLTLVFGMTQGQTLQKGNLVGMHVMTFTLNQNVTQDQYLDFYVNKILPAWETYVPGLKVHLVKGLRGENQGKIGMIAVFTNEKERDKLFNPDGSDTEFGKDVQKKMQSLWDELNKMGTNTTVYTDWIVQ
jgi:hypothetical protein